MIIQRGSGQMKPVGLADVSVERFLAWPIDSEYAEVCLYWFFEDRWSRYSDDTIKVSAWMNVPEKPEIKGEADVLY
jgi:hypothetical protein